MNNSDNLHEILTKQHGKLGLDTEGIRVLAQELNYLSNLIIDLYLEQNDEQR
jgi:hypothetical protein